MTNDNGPDNTTNQLWTPETIKARKLGIGASEAAAALGLSRYRSALEVYLDKTKDDLTPRADMPQTKRGRRFEKVVLDIYEDEHGTVHRSPAQITSVEHPFMFASLDAMRVDDHRPVEAKTAGLYAAREWGEVGTDNLPQEYPIQITHQMIVQRVPVGDVAALLGLDDFRRYEILLDHELAQMIIEGLAAFWKRVQDREPPPPTTGEEVEMLYRRSVPEGIAADEATAKAVSDLREIRAAIKPLQAREVALLDEIKLFLKDKDTLLINDAIAATWKTAKDSKRFDTDRFIHEHPELYAEYLTDSVGSRRFLLKEKNDAP